MTKTLSFAVVIMLVLIGADHRIIAAANQVNGPLQPDWDRTWKSRLTKVGLSANGNCVAVATEDAVAVIERSGRELWRWDFRAGNRFIVANQIAVSPSCDWLAFVGNESYRYLWIARRGGKRIPVAIRGTPLSVAISHRGDLVAFGTGANEVWLFTPQGEMRWRRRLKFGCCVQDLSFAEDDSAIAIKGWGVGVLSRDGEERWSRWLPGMRAAADLRTFVAWDEPPHGPGIGLVTLLDESGKELWTRVASAPYGVISPSGDRVVVWVNHNQQPTEADHLRRDEQARSLQLLSRSGEVVRTFSVQGQPVGFSSEGKKILIQNAGEFTAIDLEGDPLWRISKPDTPYISAPAVVTRDFKAFVLHWENHVAWFSPP